MYNSIQAPVYKNTLEYVLIVPMLECWQRWRNTIRKQESVPTGQACSPSALCSFEDCKRSGTSAIDDFYHDAAVNQLSALKARNP